MPDEKRVLIWCPQCGNENRQLLVGGHQTHYNIGDEYEEDWELGNYVMLTVCGTCKEPGLYAQFDEYPAASLWPVNHDLGSDVPKAVQDIYHEAQRVKRASPASFALQVGKLLEAIAATKGLNKKKLVDNLKDLAVQEKLPPELQDMADVLRRVRNVSAHYSGKAVHQRHAEVLDAFVKALIEYIYIAPARAAEYQKGMNSLKSDLI
jgi:hypothetical protein